MKTLMALLYVSQTSAPRVTIGGLTVLEVAAILTAVSGLLLGVIGHFSGLWGKNRDAKLKEAELLAQQERDFRTSILARLAQAEAQTKEQGAKLSEQSLKIAQLQGTVDALQQRETTLMAELHAVQQREINLISENAVLKSTLETVQKAEQAAQDRAATLTADLAAYKACPSHASCPFSARPGGSPT